VRFLKQLLQHIAGKVLVIWDGAPLHRSRVITAVLAPGGAARRPLDRVPGSAPDLHPVELVWRYLKHVALRNVCWASLDDRQYELRLALASVRHKRRRVRRFPGHCGYQV